MTALVLGFGPFGEVTENPSSRLAGALDGRIVGSGGTRVVGQEMPVSYIRCLDFTLALVAEHRPDFVLGIGVAVARTRATVETTARRHFLGRTDVDGEQAQSLPDGPNQLECPDAAPLALALGLDCSADAGDYVCNHWFYGALLAGLPAAFLHIPQGEMDADSTAERIGAFLDARFARE